MNATRTLATKDQILQAYRRLQEEYRREATRIATREEEALKVEDRTIVAAASGYTVENIVKGLADLQLTFNRIIEDTADRLETESDRLGQLRRAITVETAHLEHLREVRLAADALDILKQETTETQRRFEERAQADTAALIDEREKTRQSWSVADDAHERSGTEYSLKLTRARQLSEADFDYSRQRSRTVEADAFEKRRRQVLREQTEEDENHLADWTAREAALTEGQTDFDKNKVRLEAFGALLEGTRKTAREEAIKKADRHARVAASLEEKSIEARRRFFTFKIETLTARITRNDAEIDRLQARLAEARTRSATLATSALTPSTTSAS
ncbi:MAG: hypothetical protein ACI8RZ_003879 [Myxococcota bacterium]|jgi:hypothetical protein